MSSAFTPRRKALVAFTAAYGCGFYAFYYLRGNPEFLLYLTEFLCFLALAVYLLWRWPRFPDHLLVLLSLIGLLHVAGGGIKVGGTTLYDLHLFTLFDGGSPDYYVLKYDQLVHFIGFGTAGLAIRAILLRRCPALSPLLRSALAILTAMGLGALNEVSEFSAVVAFSRTGVGGYYNTALDLSFNLLGAALFVLAAECARKARKPE